MFGVNFHKKSKYIKKIYVKDTKSSKIILFDHCLRIKSEKVFNNRIFSIKNIIWRLGVKILKYENFGKNMILKNAKNWSKKEKIWYKKCKKMV